jgi:hypothetical protein
VVAEWKEMTTTSSSSAGEREMTLQVVGIIPEHPLTIEGSLD